MLEYGWPGNIRELENMVKRYTIVGNEPQIIRELSTHKPIMRAEGREVASIGDTKQDVVSSPACGAGTPAQQSAIVTTPLNGNAPGSTEKVYTETPSLLEIGRRASMQAERALIERTLAQTKWNRRKASTILKISYKSLLNKLKALDVHDRIESLRPSA
jgi:DNA-binding NtrC family response regulator